MGLKENQYHDDRGKGESGEGAEVFHKGVHFYRGMLPLKLQLVIVYT
jgi:hypothetical protein